MCETSAMKINKHTISFTNIWCARIHGEHSFKIRSHKHTTFDISNQSNFNNIFMILMIFATAANWFISHPPPHPNTNTNTYIAIMLETRNPNESRGFSGLASGQALGACKTQTARYAVFVYGNTLVFDTTWSYILYLFCIPSVVYIVTLCLINVLHMC